MICRCSIPGCKAASGRFDGTVTQWICSRHWKRITKAERRVLSRLKRIGRRYGWEAVDDRIERVWSALVRRAGQ